ncbi:response regulator [Ureibacillus sp. FSL K6-3587]|uniref:response regulator n=1 Tax=unclassified Ureibacillus TaxID=2638520 RepID=UPI0031591FEE
MKKILIVDDQKGIRMLLDEIFTKEGMETFLAANGREALQILEEQKMDCVLLDMNLPGMDGSVILGEMKALYPDMPVFIMTAYEDAEMLDGENGYKADSYFTKPFNVFELKDAVINALQKGKVLSE